ncbi:hypothetical protein IIE26_26865 (plasmid) [Cytobacillus oceanisediminis]|nr:hypothetical protein [Cytobacillus oceanisediminis]QOK29991.1 hypothetical protein IIE26_26865 [Cytobacillus oceanisediminis]
MSNQKIRNENSPLEEKMQEELDKEGIKFKAQLRSSMHRKTRRSGI